jgi:methionyl-tRNA formyltransferase
MKIALVAEESAGAQAIKRTMTSGHEIVFVLTQSNRDIPVLTRERIHIGDPRNVKNAEFAQELRRLKVDVLLNVHSLYLIHPDVFGAPHVGAFNIHPGPLPEYAGINTVSWAVYEGAREYGATLHWLTAGIDAGPVAYDARFPIDGAMTAGRLMALSVREGLGLLDQLLNQLCLAPREVPVLDQDRSRRRYYDRSVPHNGRIHWADAKAAEIDALVRACDYDPYPSPWGKVATTIKDTDVQLTRVVRTGRVADKPGGSVGDATSRGVLVAASDEWLEVLSVIVGGQPMSGRGLITHFIP